MHRALLGFFCILCLREPSAAQDPVAAARWSVKAECRMIVAPQKAVLPLMPELMDETKIDVAVARLEQMTAKGEATLAANLVLQGEAGSQLVAESIEELRYATEFDSPNLPHNTPKENAAEVLKNWPLVGIQPTAFETRNVGAILELQAKVSADGQWIAAQVVPQHVRLLRFDKINAGVMPSGERLGVEQPQFLTLKNTITVHLRAGQRILAGLHVLPNLQKSPAGEPQMELFLLKIETLKTGVTP